MPIEFAFAQARIQARLGQRLKPGAWQALEASQGLSHYLHAVRGTSLKPWIRHLTENADSHLIERSLREDWRRQVHELSEWLPTRWRAAVLWVRTLADLPAVVYLLRDGPAWPWMREDPALRKLAVAGMDARRLALRAAELAPLGSAPDDAITPLAAWRVHWQGLCPPLPAQCVGLDKLGQAFTAHVGRMQDEGLTLDEAAGQRERLEQNLVKWLHRYRELPMAIFSYLGLLALDLQRLRGGLVRRAVLTTVARE